MASEPGQAHGPDSPKELKKRPWMYVFRKTARNFNPDMATAGKFCVAEVEEIVPVGSLDPNAIHLPGIFVNRIIQGKFEKRIEQRTVRKKESV